MSSEVKVVQTPVEQALGNLKQSIQALEPSFAKDIKGENVLDVMDKLNEMNHSLQEVLSLYQELLIQSEASTTQAVEAIKQTDEQLASQIRILK